MAKTPAKPAPKPPPKVATKHAVEPVTAPAIKKIAGKALQNPQSVTQNEVRRLAASVEAHIKPQKVAKRKP